MRRYPVFYKDAPCGEMTVGQEGLYLHFRARVSFNGAGIPRIYLRCERGEALLGVAEPEETGYALRRNLAASGMEKLGKIQRVELRVQGRADTGRWRSLGQEELRFCRKFCLNLPPRNGLFRTDESGREIAFPYSERTPFPMSGLFSLARIETVGGKEYAVFAFHRNGDPILRKK